MRLFVFFDLPTNTKLERKQASKFRNFLLRSGFYMLQYSIYCRVCRSEQGVMKYGNWVKKDLPSYGNVRMMQVTEKQYQAMEILVGEIPKQEKIGAQQILLF